MIPRGRWIPKRRIQRPDRRATVASQRNAFSVGGPRDDLEASGHEQRAQARRLDALELDRVASPERS